MARSRISTRRTTTQVVTEDANETVRKAFSYALGLMRESGYGVDSKIQVVVDPRLPFMGYTTPQGRDFRIVVAGGAVETGMVEGLLIHEMSHAYRMHSKHPSHNPGIIQEVIGSVTKGMRLREYQQEILGNQVNDVEDMYADDVSFRVMGKAGIFPKGQMSRFLQDWVSDEIVESHDSVKARWENASTLVHNARAIAQMERHGVEDLGGRAASTNERFLAKLSPAAAERSEYFRKLLADMKENITESEYRSLLTEYLTTFLETVQEI